ncbi:hypothetical protein VZ94_16760 [Methylocucumis oryzae]|uniref:Calcium-binding protein n=1 Tax=Methylocucumis oryzae TaxID=1632867 RepID=A0A0F3IGH7_9GAMM|nr:hypothetical protein VZ94_16760 [Methylocucumis oryzae]
MLRRFTDLGTGGSVDVLKIAAAAGVVTATVTGDWTATSGSYNLGTAITDVILNTAASNVDLTEVTTGNGWTINNTAAAALSLKGSGGNDSITGGTTSDTLVGNAGNDTLVTGVTTAGNTDSMTGGAGNDTFNVAGALGTVVITDWGNGVDVLSGALGAATGAINVTISNSSATALSLATAAAAATNTATVTGGTAADTITGGAGNDSISGGNGADSITAGDGDDTIVLTETVSAVDKVVLGATFAANGTDTITGFKSGTDKIDINAFGTATSFTTTGAAVSFTAAANAVLFFSGGSAGDADSSAASITFMNANLTYTDTAATFYAVVVDDDSTTIYEVLGDAGGDEFTGDTLSVVATIGTVMASSDFLFT